MRRISLNLVLCFPFLALQAMSYHIEASNHPCEDVLMMEPNLGPGKGGLFSIIDGHGGATSAQIIAQILPVEYRKLLDQGVPPGRALVDALAEVERIILKMSKVCVLVRLTRFVFCGNLSTYF